MQTIQHTPDAELLALLVGSTTAKALAGKPLAELFGFVTPRQMQLGEPVAEYHIHPVLSAAKTLFLRGLQEAMQTETLSFSSPENVKAFLCGQWGHLEHEVFVCLWLDAQHRLIQSEEMFRGTIAQASVYPREVVKAALRHNAAAVIFAHNHPSGLTTPSEADQRLTRELKQALTYVDVRVLDHFVVAGHQALSMAEKGLI